MEKAGFIGFVKMRQLEVDDDFSLRGHVLENAIEVMLASWFCCLSAFLLVSGILKFYRDGDM